MATSEPRAACTHPLNYYQEEQLAKIERMLHYAERTRRDDFDSWRNSYEDDVRWLVNELKLRVPK